MLLITLISSVQQCTRQAQGIYSLGNLNQWLQITIIFICVDICSVKADWLGYAVRQFVPSVNVYSPGFSFSRHLKFPPIPTVSLFRLGIISSHNRSSRYMWTQSPLPTPSVQPNVADFWPTLTSYPQSYNLL